LNKSFFGTDGIRGEVGQAPMTPDFILKLGWAAGKVLAKKGVGKAIIGKDTRISGYMYESALEAGLAAAGIDTLLLGPITARARLPDKRCSTSFPVILCNKDFRDNPIKMGEFNDSSSEILATKIMGNCFSKTKTRINY